MKKAALSGTLACLAAFALRAETTDHGIVPSAAPRCAEYVNYLRPYAVNLNGASEGQYGLRHALPALAVFKRGGGNAELIGPIKASLRSYSEWAAQQVATSGAVQSFDGVTLFATYARELRKSGQFGPDDERIMRKTILLLRQYSYGVVPGDGPWRGSQHRGMVDGTNNMIAAALYPGETGAKNWRSRGEAVWNDWWSFRDIGINDNVYFNDSLAIMLRTADLLHRKEVFSDESVKATIWDRLLFETTPGGAAVPYGATAGWNGVAGIRIYALMLAAQHSGDGRYRFVADRLFDYARSHGGFSPGEHHWASVSVEATALAALACDDAVVAVEPDTDPKLLARPEIVRLDKTAAMSPLGHFDAEMTMTAARIPSKLAFRTGWSTGSMFMLVEAMARHDPLNPTAILALERFGTSFAEATYEKEISHENNVRVSDQSGEARSIGAAGGRGRRLLPLGYREMSTSVDPIVWGGLGAHARLTVTNYAGYPLTQVRDILFVNERFVLLRDESEFQDGFVAKVGPAWNTQHALHEDGTQWIDSWIDAHWYNGNIKLYDNPPGRLLIWHAPMIGAALKVSPAKTTSVNDDDPRAALNHFVTEEFAWQGRVVPGQKVQFTTLLFPHQQEEQPGKLAAGIRVLRDKPGLVAIMVQDDLILLNSTGATLSIDTGRGNVVSNAKALVMVFGGTSVAKTWHDGGRVMINGQVVN